MQNLQALAAAWGVGTEFIPVIIDLIKNSRLLQSAVVQKASHGIKHRYRIYNNLPEAAFREIGQGITPQKLDINTAQIDLKELVFDLFDDYKAVDEYPSGKDGYVIDATPAALAAIAQSLTKALFYGNTATIGIPGGFKGFHQYAVDLGNTINAGGTNNASTGIYAVRWDAESGASIRVNNKALIDIKDLTPNQPTPIVTNTTDNIQLDVYKWKFSSYATLVVASAKSVAKIRGLDSANAVTAAHLNSLIDMVDDAAGQVFLYANRTGINQIRNLKNTKLNLFSETSDYNTRVASWNGVPILLDENIVNTEPNA